MAIRRGRLTNLRGTMFSNKCLALFAAVLLLGGLPACKNSSEPGGGSKSPTAAPATILRLSGSNTIGARMAPMLAEAFLRAQGATNVKTLDGANPEEKIVQGVLPSETSPSRITVSAHGSATAFVALADGSCDIGMASREIKIDEAAKLLSLGDMFSAANEHVLGLDGIAVIVHPANPINSLAKDQIMQIFTGEFSDWAQLGFSSGPIKIYARDDKSGTFDTFKALVLAGKPLAPGAQRFEDSSALSDAVANDPHGIGFIGLPYVNNARAIAVSEKGARPAPHAAHRCDRRLSPVPPSLSLHSGKSLQPLHSQIY